MERPKDDDGYDAPWAKLFGGLFVSLGVGSIFSFGSLSPEFQMITGASESQAAVIGLAGDVGLWFYIIPGTSFDRYGTRFGFAVGASLVAVGAAATVIALLVKAQYAIVAATWAVLGHGLGWLFCHNLLSNVKSWQPNARGYAVGSLQAFFGMSGPFFISVYENNIFNQKILIPFVAFMGVFTVLAVVFAIYMGGGADNLLEVGVLNDRAKRRYTRVSFYIVFLLLLIVSTSLAEQTTWSSYIILLAFILTFPVMFFDRIVGETFADEKVRTKTDDDHVAVGVGDDDKAEPLLLDDDDDDANLVTTTTTTPVTTTTPPVTTTTTPPVTTTRPRNNNKEPLACVSPEHWIEFWELFVTFGVLVGGALSTSNSMSAIARSLKTCQSMKITAAALSLLTVSDAFGRFFSGVLINKKVCDGSVVMAAGAIFLGASHTAYSAAHAVTAGPYSSGDGFLFLAASALSGLADGTAWTACPWLTAARFGTNRYGDNFGVVAMAAAISIVILVKGVLPVGDKPSKDDDYQQVMYNCTSVHDDDDSVDKACYGAECFAVFHRTIQAASVVALVCALDMERRRYLRQRRDVSSGGKQAGDLHKADSSSARLPTITEEKSDDGSSPNDFAPTRDFAPTPSSSSS